MGGYDKHLHYGGPEPTNKGLALFILALIIFGALFFTYDAYTKQQFDYCSGPNRHTCVVDGDTIWLDGQKIRLKGYDTPEPLTHICGGQNEKILAGKASARLIQLLNTSDWEIEYFGNDNSGKRRLATIRIGGEDVGDILVREQLARYWPDGDEFWCDQPGASLQG